MDVWGGEGNGAREKAINKWGGGEAVIGTAQRDVGMEERKTLNCVPFCPPGAPSGLHSRRATDRLTTGAPVLTGASRVRRKCSGTRNSPGG